MTDQGPMLFFAARSPVKQADGPHSDMKGCLMSIGSVLLRFPLALQIGVLGSEFDCNVPGHFEAGMKGLIAVDN
jgi:hypothetical protein